MNKSFYLPLVTVVVLTISHFGWTVNGENLQFWSHRVYEDESIELYCGQGDTKFNITQNLNVHWTRHGSSTPIISGDGPFTLLNDNSTLRIENVTNELSGFYFCHVSDSNGEVIQTAMQAVNPGYYQSNPPSIKRYRENLIRGIITAAAVFVIVMFVGTIGSFRYLTEEQREKRMDRKEKHKSQQIHDSRGLTRMQQNGFSNQAVQTTF